MSECNDRGFRVFGTVTDHDGETWTVSESSLAFEDAHVRVFPSKRECADFVPYGKPSAWRKHVPSAPVTEHLAPSMHLSVREAETLALMLMRFVEEAHANKLTEPAESPEGAKR